MYAVFKVHRRCAAFCYIKSAFRFLPNKKEVKSCLRGFARLSGDGGIRTLDLLLARQALSQLSYAPVLSGMVVYFSN